MLRLACSWSGGKDSCFALMEALRKGHTLSVLINMMNESGKISRSHGLPLQVLQQQAEAMNTKLIATPASWTSYRQRFIESLLLSKKEDAIDAMVFGDIDLQAHKVWEEEVCTEAGLKALLPLWQQDRKQLVHAMLDSGIKAVIVSCNEVLGEEFLGRELNSEILPHLEQLGVDVCGENGEFHTAVIDCPLFKFPVQLPPSSKVLHDSYWFLQWHIAGLSYGNVEG